MVCIALERIGRYTGDHATAKEQERPGMVGAAEGRETAGSAFLRSRVDA